MKIDRTTYLFFLDGIVDFSGEVLAEVDSCGSNMAKRCWWFLAETTHGRSISIRFVSFKQQDFLMCVVRVVLVSSGQ
jgi:hypothetical protein